MFGRMKKKLLLCIIEYNNNNTQKINILWEKK